MQLLWRFTSQLLRNGGWRVARFDDMGMMQQLGDIPSPGSVADHHYPILTKRVILLEWQSYSQSREGDLNEKSPKGPHLLT